MLDIDEATFITDVQPACKSQSDLHKQGKHDNQLTNVSTKATKETVVTWIAWTCVLLGVVAAGFGLYTTDREAKGFSSLGNLGNFGSYAQGTVASLWSLGALFFLYATLLAQRRQIDQQESQLEQQRLQFDEEQKRQKLENEKQEKQFQSQQHAIELQNFGTSFFQLLQIFNQIITDLVDYRRVHTNIKDIQTLKYERRQCFTFWYTLLIEDFNDAALETIANVRLPTNKPDEHLVRDQENPPEGQLPTPCTDERIVKLYYEEFYDIRQALIGHYFRIMYHIVKFVDASDVLQTYDEKRRYVSLLRAQLSAHELILIFYNGISTKAIKFKPLIEKYGLLEHLDKKLLLDESHSHFYRASAYK